MRGAFSGRSLSVVQDFSVDEQLYLYQKTRELKDGLKAGKSMDEFRVSDSEFSIYLMFLEDSTRTKESFRNAAKFHGARVNDFDAKSSSFNKKESLTDTIKMLVGYARKSMFIIRSKQEGTCTCLDHSIGEYADMAGFPKPSFINAGDGKHEHPTQEFLDEFSFLEQQNWNRDSIHLALVGDLHHGRTVHSKADGLNIFKDVTVDLIAPNELSMPEFYIAKMKKNGYKVRIFQSIEEYLNQDKVAKIWYFTRLQLERMGEEVLEKAAALRASVTFAKSYIDRLPEGTKFYHPLPRHREFPVIPGFLDHTSLNGWDLQSANGYYTRIMEIALLSGRVGDDFTGQAKVEEEISSEFIEEVQVKKQKKPEYKVGIKPVESGIVIDHIAKGRPLREIWNHIDKIRHIMNLNLRSSHGVFHTDNPDEFKGIMSLPDVLSFDETQLKMLAAIAPGCTLNIIEDSKVAKKYRLHMPPKVYNFDEISCKNENCISNPDLFENVMPLFYRSDKSEFVCHYCEKSHTFHDIWDI